MTRPKGPSNGGGIEPDVARAKLQRLTRTFPLVTDPSGAYPLWLDLCARTEVRGILCHDAYLAACALAIDVPVYALDRDFARFGVRAA